MSAVGVEKPRRRVRPARVLLHTFLIATSLGWLAPLVWAFFTSLRPYAETAKYGWVSWPKSLSLDNYFTAWDQADMPTFFLNTMIITIPAVVVTLFLASFVGFGVSRFSWRGNKALLILFTAGNLLPPQIMLTPLFRLYLEIGLPYEMSDSELLYNSYWGIIAVHVAFQIGFCAFVLSNYMRTLPVELTEAAIMDGASVWRQYWQVIMPLCRPALAALATLEFTWIYNDFIWAIVLMNNDNKRPITSGLANLKGYFLTDNNLIAAGSLLAAIPTLIVFFVLQRQFIGGLTLGGTKG
jgi:multiple sugar transport system permease protein